MALKLILRGFAIFLFVASLYAITVGRLDESVAMAVLSIASNLLSGKI